MHCRAQNPSGRSREKDQLFGAQGIPGDPYFLSWILVWAIWPRYMHSDGLPEESARKKTRMVEFDVKSI